MKPKTVYIIAIIISILLLGICSGSLYLFTKKNERFLEKQKSNQLEKDSIDNILRISRMLENNKFTELFKELEGKSDNDSIYYRPKESYISVEEITKIAKEKQAEIRKENERIDREKNRLKSKYLFVEGSGWLHEKQRILMNMGFREYKSGFEEAADGSSQIALYYKKSENGFTVHVRLQYSYSLSHHYARLWVEENY